MKNILILAAILVIWTEYSLSQFMSVPINFARFTATDAMGMVKHATVSKLVLMK